MRIENLLDSSADGIFVFDKRLITTVWNKKLVTQFGCSKKDYLQKTISKTPFFIKYSSFNQIAKEVLKGTSHSSNHNVYAANDEQRLFYYTLTIEPIYEVGKIVGGLGTVKDVFSVDKQNEIYTFNELVYDNNTLPKIVFSNEGKPIHINDSYRNLWKMNPKTERYILNNYNLFHDEQLASLEQIHQLKKTGKFLHPEIPVLEYETNKTSSIKSLKNVRKKISGYIKTNLNDEGEFASVEVTLVDLSEKNNSQFNNPWIVQKFHKLTKNLPGVIYEFVSLPDEYGFFNYISQSCTEVFGVSGEQIKANPKLMKQLIHPDDIVSYLRSTKKATAKFTDWNWEGRFIVNGKTKWIRGSSRPEKLANGKVIRYGILTDISGEKRAQKRQKEATKQLNLAIKGANLGLWDWSLSNNSINTNDRFIEILGYQKLQFKQKTKDWFEYIHPNERNLVYQKVINHLKGLSEFLEIEMRIQKADSTWIWISTKAQVTKRSPNGKALQLAGTIQDINNRKQYEKILAQSEARYRGLVEYSPLAIVVYRNEKIVFANDKAYNLLGVNWEKEELVGMDILDFVKPEHRKTTNDRIQQIFKSKKASPTVEELLVRKDGKQITVEMVSIPFEDEGQPAIQIIASDITDKVSNERVLKRSEKLLTQLFDNSPIGIVLLDSARKVVQINRGFQNIFGYTNDEAYRKKLNQLIIPKGYRGQAININTLITEGNIVKEVESVRRDKDGNLVPVMIYGVPVSLNEKVIAIYGIYVDMRASKKVEEELKVRNEELDNFVYKVSHDLRAPLSSTLGLVHLANLDKNSDNLREYIKLIGERISQLDRFIADVLSHSKNLKVEINYSKIDFKNIIHNKFTELDYLPDADTIEKRISVQGNDFYGDKWRISEVLRNLISNAIKYMNADIDNSFIDIDIRVTKQKVTIVFADNGIGIPEDMLPRIFEMFYRATESSEGSGIGLYIVKNAIDKMNGNIKIESEEGIGTTYKIELPNQGQ